MGQPIDFGARSPDSRIEALVPWFAGAIAVMMVVGGAAWELAWQHRQIAESASDARLSQIAGPPCPTVAAPAFQAALKRQDLSLKYVFTFNGATFGRAIGYADCDSAPAGPLGVGAYDVCQFTSPAVLYVKTAKGEFYFLTGVGQKATVMTPNGVARCVMAAPKLDD